MLDKIVDLTVPMYEGMPTDDLGPKFWVQLSHERSQQFQQNTQSRERRFFLTTDHVGTHIDGPLRFDPKGISIEKLPLESVIRPAQLIDLRSIGRSGAIGPAELMKTGANWQPGDAAVLWTDHDLRLKSPTYFWHRPQLTMEGALWLAERRPGIVATDFPGFGRPFDDRYEVKRALHREGILTVEQLCNLGELAGKRWHLCAAPLRIRGTAGSLLRAVGLVDFKPRELVDVTLDIFPGMGTFPPVPVVWMRAKHDLTSFFYKGELSYQTASMLLAEHAGSHIDAPFHFDPQGLTIDQLPLSRLWARARVFDMTYKKPLEGIGPRDFVEVSRNNDITLGSGDAAVVWTGHSENYERPDYTSNRPFITTEGTEWLRARHPSLVVTDLVGLDEPSDLTEPAHNGLLRAGIPQVQVLTNLGRLAKREAWIAAFPLKLVGGTGSPLRAFAALA